MARVGPTEDLVLATSWLGSSGVSDTADCGAEQRHINEKWHGGRKPLSLDFRRPVEGLIAPRFVI